MNVKFHKNREDERWDQEGPKSTHSKRDECNIQDSNRYDTNDAEGPEHPTCHNRSDEEQKQTKQSCIHNTIIPVI